MNRFLDQIIARLRVQFDPEVMSARLFDLLSNLVVGVLTFAAFYAVWWVGDRIARGVLRRSSVDATSAGFIRTFMKFVVLSFGVVQALSSVGINTAALVTSLGIAGLTVGFAARDALSNLISGILIFWDRPFVIGDLVEVEGQYGRVERITLRSTRVVTSDGRMLAVPNSTVINTTVASYTNFPNLRLDVSVTIGVHEDVERARKILLGLVADTPGVLSDPPPRVVVTALNDYNVALELQVWIEDERQHVERRFDLRERVFKAFTEAGVDMPFETLAITPVEVRTLGGPGAVLANEGETG